MIVIEERTEMRWWLLRRIHCYADMHHIVQWPRQDEQSWCDAGYCLDRFTLRNG